MIKQIDGNLLKKMIISSANHLENNKKMVDALNVFPVPDGDTGTNMSLTLRAAAVEVDKKEKAASVIEIADILASASLRGARGNSGVILSQLFRGFTKMVKKHGYIDGSVFAKALKGGADTAYKAVMKPTEGTILTVAREVAKKALEMSQKTDDIIEILEVSLVHANAVLDKTPEMLTVLKQAGVVDAGGKGLVIILEGALYALKNDEGISKMKNEKMEDKRLPKQQHTTSNQEIVFGYCTEFLIEKSKDTTNRVDIVNQFKSRIDRLGDSMLVIDDDDVVKVHVHTNHPGIVIEEALKIGQLINIKIDNMREQHEHIIEDQSQSTPVKEENEKEYGFIAVAVGDGIVSVLEDLGIDKVIEGGQTMNPSTDDILNAIKSIHAKNVFVFPNNKNIILAAEQAKALADKNVLVVPTKNIPQGISSMIAFDGSASPEQNYENMLAAISVLTTGSVTYAVRDFAMEDKEIKQGDILGIREGEIYTAGKSVEQACKQLIDGLIEEDSEIVTIFYGQDIDEQTANALSEYIESKYPDCDIEVHNGGQPLYYYIISVEA